MRDPSMRAIRPSMIVGTLLLAGLADAAGAAGNGVVPRAIVVGQARQEIKRLPIEHRPYHPLHVYGNTVRRRHHRGATPPSR
jgi:hypothetical protein